MDIDDRDAALLSLSSNFRNNIICQNAVALGGENVLAKIVAGRQANNFGLVTM